MVLSALFDETSPSKTGTHAQPMSGLLNLSKQQQELLSNSKVCQLTTQ